jgi:hypothetical protein
MNILLYGLLTGVGFGFFLQRGRVLRYDKQVGALRLQDMTIMKFMLTSIVVAMVGIYALKDMGLVKLMFMPAALGGNILGGLLLGAGWALLGYCPGTSVGALGEGRWDAIWGILGMFIGAAVFAELYPAIKGTIFPIGYLGSYTLPQAMGLNHWLVIPVFVVGVLALFRWFEKIGL